MLISNRAGARAAGSMIIVSAAAFTAPAFAATTSSTLNVDATVTANCTVSTSPIAFGSVNPISGADVDASGGITVTCTNGTGWTAAAGVGSGSGASFASRRMSDGSNLLSYNIYTDSGRTSVWGDGTGSTATIGNTGDGSAQSVTVYGRVASGQTSVPPGDYDDTVSVTVTY
jgi:spore coat protein U-like protein